MKSYLLSALFSLLAICGWSQVAINGVVQNGPIITFESDTFDYGNIAQNSAGIGEFCFTNTGNESLILSCVKTSCGCLVATWPKEPIAPGEKGFIRIKYDTKRVGPTRKYVSVQSNAVNASRKILYVRGKVLSTQNNEYIDGAIISFENDIYDYGTIEENADGHSEFHFTNTGNKPLIISNVKTSCGCLVPYYDYNPVKPGEKGVIRLKYYTKRIGPINKSVTVTSNAINTPVKRLRIKGTVLPVIKR